MAYVTLHYHYHSDLTRIIRSKEMHTALIALYDASIQLYPVGSAEFSAEDSLIATAVGNDKGLRRATGAYLRRIGIDTYKMVSMFGTVVSAEYDNGKQRHWFRPSQTYAIIERALGHEASATALATRIWRSFVVSGQNTLSKDDISEVFGPFRTEDAESFFKALDPSNLANITLDDIVAAVTSMARTRHAVFAGMASFNHVINTLDWVGQAMICVVMMFFVISTYMPVVKTIQRSVSQILIGMGFALGRTVHHFLCGAVFILFDHPYDVGDRVELWNTPGTSSQSLIVERLSLLYTVFKRSDNGVSMQVANETLATARIENLTRGGVKKTSIKISVDVSTSFQDLCNLKSEMESFIKANPRDYTDKISFSIQGLNSLNTMDIKCGYGHLGDPSDEKAGGQRNMRFMCAFVTALRKIGIKRPHGEIGDQGRPMYTVMMENDGTVNNPSATEEGSAPIEDQAKEYQTAEIAAVDKLVKSPTAQKKTADSAVASGVETHVMTGLRVKTNGGAEGMFPK